MRGVGYCSALILLVLAQSSAAFYVYCETSSGLLDGYEQICDGEIDCDDQSDEKYCQENRTAFSIERKESPDRSSIEHFHDRLTSTEHCLGWAASFCPESQDREPQCQACIVNPVMLKDGIRDMVYGIDETNEAGLAKQSRDRSLMRRVLFHGEWRCHSSRNTVTFCSSLKEHERQPFLYAIPMDEGPCADIVPGLHFWECPATKRCIRKGFPCLDVESLCQPGYKFSPYDEKCVSMNSAPLNHAFITIFIAILLILI